MADPTRMRIDDLQLTIQPKEFVRLDDKDFSQSIIYLFLKFLKEYSNGFAPTLHYFYAKLNMFKVKKHISIFPNITVLNLTNF